jgi:hypothetical protein
MKICPVGAKLFHADGQTERERERERERGRQTDRHGEAHSRFSQFCEKRLKYGQAGRATRRMRIACWLTKTTHTHNTVFNTLFSMATMVSQTRRNIG